MAWNRLLQQMKILITGSAGFIGGHLYEKLAKEHDLIGIDNFFHPTKKKNPLIRELDIRDDKIIEYIQWSDIIYHLAAQIHVDYSIDKPVETFDINVNGTLKILEACRKFNKKLVFASSSEIYGTAQENFMDENHPTLPQSPYAVSKLTGDKLCTVYKEIYGMRIDVIRNFNTFGQWQNDTSYGGAIAIFTYKALKNEPIEIFGTGTQKRDYMYIEDALQGYMMSLTQDLPEPINFGTGQFISINELAKLIIKLTNSKSEIIHVKERPGEVQMLCADITKAKQLGFKPTTNLQTDLEKYINWAKSQI